MDSRNKFDKAKVIGACQRVIIEIEQAQQEANKLLQKRKTSWFSRRFHNETYDTASIAFFCMRQRSVAELALFKARETMDDGVYLTEEEIHSIKRYW